MTNMDCQFIYIMGAESGAGKSTVCLGLLAGLLAGGVPPSQLAYIKPMTQCTEPQAVAQCCATAGIPYRALDGLVFTKGFTRDFIAGLTKSSDQLLAEILQNIHPISTGKAFVIIDGIGGPAVGSVIGVANVDIALALGSKVIFVGKPGIGIAIDTTLLCVSFMQTRGIKDIGIIYNKLPANELAGIQPFVAKRTAELLPDCYLLGFITQCEQLNTWIEQEDIHSIAQWFIRYLDTARLVEHYSFNK